MFTERLKKAAEEGLLLSAKYGLVLILAWLAVQFIGGIVAGSQNGNTAILYINEAINKGYLPKAVNGALPERTDEKNSLNQSVTTK